MGDRSITVEAFSSIYEEESSFILEVQRRQGCSCELKNIRRLLFRDVLRTCEKTAPKQKLSNCQVMHMICDTNHPQQRNYIEDALRNCLLLLESKHHCQNRLGMECIQNITNSSSSVRLDDCTYICQAILVGEVGSQAGCLSNHVYKCILVSTDEDEERQTVPNVTDYAYHVLTMRSLALQVLANTLEESYLVLIDKLQSSALDDIKILLIWRNVVEKLVYILHMAIYRPEDAAVSAKCLRFMLKVDGLVLKGKNLEGVAIKAYRYGKVHHKSLEQECSSLILSLTPDPRWCA